MTSEDVRTPDRIVFCMHTPQNGVRVVQDLAAPHTLECSAPSAFRVCIHHCILAIAHTRGVSLLTLNGEEAVKGHELPDSSPAMAVRFFNNIAHLVSGYQSGAVKIHEVESAQLLSSVYLHRNCVRDIALRLDDGLVLSVGDDNLAVLVPPSSLIAGEGLRPPRDSRILRGHTASVKAAIILPGQAVCVTGSEDRSLRIWDTNSSACMRVLKDHTKAVYGLAAHPAGHLFASASTDCTVRIFNADTFESLFVFQFQDWVTSVAIDGVHNHLLAGCRGVGLVVRSLETMQLVAEFRMGALETTVCSIDYQPAQKTGLGVKPAARLPIDRETASTDPGQPATELHALLCLDQSHTDPIPELEHLQLSSHQEPQPLSAVPPLSFTIPSLGPLDFDFDSEVP
eukprot:m.107186 g.107186  ORF g.107186 m.107186 type:complete len:398 (-) comp51697_c0_seq2:43-1236(-)